MKYEISEKQLAYKEAMRNKEYEKADKLFDEMLSESFEEACSRIACRNCKHKLKDENRDLFCGHENPPRKVELGWEQTGCDEKDFEPDKFYLGPDSWKK